MDVTRTYEIHSQIDGDFLGCCEVIEGDNFAYVWDEGGNFDTLINIAGESSEGLYKTIIDEFAAESGLAHEDIYLTDDECSEILFAA